MKMPRDWSGEDLARQLERLGYTITRQTGSHLRCTTVRNGEHHVTIPRHAALKVGTLHQRHFGLETTELLDTLTQ